MEFDSKVALADWLAREYASIRDVSGIWYSIEHEPIRIVESLRWIEHTLENHPALRCGVLTVSRFNNYTAKRVVRVRESLALQRLANGHWRVDLTDCLESHPLVEFR